MYATSRICSGTLRTQIYARYSSGTTNPRYSFPIDIDLTNEKELQRTFRKIKFFGLQEPNVANRRDQPLNIRGVGRVFSLGDLSDNIGERVDALIKDYELNASILGCRF